MHAFGPIPAVVAVGAAAHLRRLEQRLAVRGRRRLLSHAFPFAPLVAASWAAAVVELNAIAEAHVAVRGQLIRGREGQRGEDSHEHGVFGGGAGARKFGAVDREFGSPIWRLNPPTRTHTLTWRVRTFTQRATLRQRCVRARPRCIHYRIPEYRGCRFHRACPRFLPRTTCCGLCGHDSRAVAIDSALVTHTSRELQVGVGGKTGLSTSSCATWSSVRRS